MQTHNCVRMNWTKNFCKTVEFFILVPCPRTDQPAKDATVAAVTCAKEAGALISYDPNYRATLWSSEAEAAENMKSMISYADVMKVSDEESLLLTGETTYEAAADKLLAMGPKLIAVTLGSEGVLMATKEKKERVKGFSVQSVDTTGAGDSFWGGTLSAYLSLEKPIESLTWEEIHHCAVCGNATAALCVQKRGGIPAIPTKEEVEQMLAEKSC
ncbi:MAG: carbohydrate kinase family protein [Eubacterium ramulus]